jgi:hypothetical protein
VLCYVSLSYFEEIVETPIDSFLELAKEFCGCVEGPEDLSTNPEYMEDYGSNTTTN